MPWTTLVGAYAPSKDLRPVWPPIPRRPTDRPAPLAGQREAAPRMGRSTRRRARVRGTMVIQPEKHEKKRESMDAMDSEDSR